MAEHWNLPERIINTIKYYHTPLSAPEEHQLMCKIIYLAHMLWRIINNEEKNTDINQSIFEEFEFSSDRNFKELLEHVIEFSSN